MSTRSQAFVKKVVLDALMLNFGHDNADAYEDDPFTLGVSFPDGEFVQVCIESVRAEVPSPSPEPTETIMSDWASPPPGGEAERTFTVQQVHDIVGWVTGKPGLEALIDKAIEDYLAVHPEPEGEAAIQSFDKIVSAPEPEGETERPVREMLTSEPKQPWRQANPIVRPERPPTCPSEQDPS